MQARFLSVVLFLCYMSFATTIDAQLIDGIILGGNIRLADGGSLIFPDGSMQGTATVQGPAGPQGPKGDTGATGLPGPQGPAGVAYVKTVVVSPAGTALENGTALLAALADITASAASPSLLKIEPGYYELNGNSLVMKPFVDVQGSGENVTVITSAVSGLTNGVVNGADNAEIRFLTIRNTGTGSDHIALVNSSASPRITNVTVAVIGNGAFNYGIINTSASPVMNNVTIVSSGAESYNHGILNESSSSTMTNVTVTARGGSQSCYGITNNFSSPIIKSVTVTCSGASYTNDGIRNNSYSSPIISDVSVAATGGIYSSGISSFQSSPVLSNVTATASGATHSNWGVYIDGSTPVMTNIIATASGGLNAVGTEVTSSSFAMSNVTAKGSGATNNYGLHSFGYSGSNTVTIDRSTFEGSTNSIYNNAYLTIRIGGSKLVGNANTEGVFRCANTYDGDYLPLGNDCK